MISWQESRIDPHAPSQHQMEMKTESFPFKGEEIIKIEIIGKALTRIFDFYKYS